MWPLGVVSCEKRQGPLVAVNRDLSPKGREHGKTSCVPEGFSDPAPWLISATSPVTFETSGAHKLKTPHSPRAGHVFSHRQHTDGPPHSGDTIQVSHRYQPDMSPETEPAFLFRTGRAADCMTGTCSRLLHLEKRRVLPAPSHLPQQSRGEDSDLPLASHAPLRIPRTYTSSVNSAGCRRAAMARSPSMARAREGGSYPRAEARKRGGSGHPETLAGTRRPKRPAGRGDGADEAEHSDEMDWASPGTAAQLCSYHLVQDTGG